MSSKTKNTIIIAVGLALMILTYGLYTLLFFDKTLETNISFGFLLFSELVFVIALIVNVSKSPGSKIFMRAGLSVISIFYVAFTAIMLFVSAIGVIDGRIILVLQILGLFVFIIISLAVLCFHLRVKLSNENLTEDIRLMQICEQDILALLNQNKNERIEDELKSLYEDFKYADKVGATSIDKKIVDGILQLSKETTSENIDIVKTLLSQRKVELLGNKRAGF